MTMSRDCKWLAWSSGNIGSGGMDQVCGIASITADPDPVPAYKFEEITGKYTFEKHGEKKKCLLQ
jgi:hypothetical protein